MMTMTRRWHLKGWLAAAGMAATPVFAAAPFNGTWSGTLIAGATRLILRLVIDDTTATLFSVSQGNGRIPASSMAIEGRTITLTFTAIKATFEGTLSDNDHIEGTFFQGAPLPLRFNRGDVPEPVAEPTFPALTPEILNDKRMAAYTPAMGAGWSKGTYSGLFVKGARSSDDEIAAQPEDQWHWGSITKSMTATLCARMVEAGVIDWQTTVGKVLGAKTAGPYAQATLVHLLSHRAGLQPNLDLMNAVFYSRDPLPDARDERRKWALAALKQKPVGPVGKQNVYSNNGYIVAGAMLETLTGKAWEALMQQEVFTPLAIENAGFGAPGRPGQIDQPLGHAVQGHNRKPMPVGPKSANDNPVALGPAGRVHMPIASMLTYLRAHRDRPATFLRAESWAALHTPHFGDDYALGWVVRPDGSLWHNGSNTMWYAEVLVDVKTGTVACATANDFAPDTQKAVGEVLMSARAAALADVV
ncbi:serine hydrolase [Asticcacaulis sp. BYS171W]|uniref:Serine hydrolase n=1 Tax=Asticcacaulis aquaticus TaxID=2984212 RepID=A0ABT5HSS4_9CAUL|nr:serine hydrolase domain-containing protein [Asticcacaulis aquaticus]MDC7683110.1 serine hydrolase [Asticcacaulis aquaticus]